ncbi:uncharacterized protein TNCT_683611 [Trichonephila clavata]|uniref:Uncharacterized protein n=1 Tax=Trichonephila clavata TaxID=2740835 RepID=A0A8X6GYS5_TRICU|nr:uncharacterized protein TNCT_683611 [Trichonephila clavata]
MSSSYKDCASIIILSFIFGDPLTDLISIFRDEVMRRKKMKLLYLELSVKKANILRYVTGYKLLTFLIELLHSHYKKLEMLVSSSHAASSAAFSRKCILTLAVGITFDNHARHNDPHSHEDLKDAVGPQSPVSFHRSDEEFHKDLIASIIYMEL